MRHTYSYSEHYHAYIRDCIDYYMYVPGAGRFNKWYTGSSDLFQLPQITVPNTLLILQGIPL